MTHTTRSTCTPDTAAARRPTVALAPFQDNDGHRTGNWIERGLMSLLAQALAAEPSLALTPVADTLKATRLAGWLPLTHRPGAIASALMADWVVDACIDATPDGLFVRSWVYDADTQASSVQCRQCQAVNELLPTLLQMIHTPMARVWPSAPLGDPTPQQAVQAARAREHFDNEVTARAQAALARQDWRIGLPLIRMAAHLNPADLGAQLSLLAALAEIGDRSVPQLTKAMVRGRTPAGDIDLATQLHVEQGAYDLGNGRPRKASQHLAKALTGASLMNQPSARRALMLRARAALMEGDLVNARALLQPLGSADHLHRTNGEVVGPLVVSALIHLDCGALEPAQAELTEAIGRSRMADLQGHLADALLAQAQLHFAAGAIDAALDTGRESLTIALEHSDPPRIAAASEVLGLILRERGQVDELRSMLQRLDGCGESPNDLSDATRRLLAAHLLSAEGKAEAAADGYLAYLHYCECADLWRAHRHAWPCAALELLKARRGEELPGLIATLRAVKVHQQAPAVARAVAGVIGHVQACAALLDGDTQRAAVLLREAIELSPPGWVLARAREAAASLPGDYAVPMAGPHGAGAWAPPSQRPGAKVGRLRRPRLSARPSSRPAG